MHREGDQIRSEPVFRQAGNVGFLRHYGDIIDSCVRLIRGHPFHERNSPPRSRVFVRATRKRVLRSVPTVSELTRIA